MKVNKQSKAEGTEGVILIYPDLSTAVECGPDEDSHVVAFGKRVKCTGTRIVFRIYEKNEDGTLKKNEKGRVVFKDYNIHHHDLRVRLLDGHFYETDEGNFLDYPGLNRYVSKTSDSDST